MATEAPPHEDDRREASDAVTPDSASMDWLDVRDAAAVLRMSPESVRAAVQRGELRADGRGARRCLLFRRSTLDGFLEARTAGDVAAVHAPSPDVQELARTAVDVGVRIATALERIAAATERHVGIARAQRPAQRGRRSAVPPLSDVPISDIDRERAKRIAAASGFKIIE